MFIIVEDDIVINSLKDNSNYSQEMLDILIELSLVVRYGIHVVYIPIIRSNPTIREALKSKLPDRSYSILVKNNKNQSLQSVRNLVKTKLVLTGDRNTHNKWKGQPAIVVNMSDNPSFRLLYPTFLITENLLDAQFYESVVLYYKKKNNIKTARINYLPIMGGGATTASTICGINNKKQGVWLAIADSDRHYPNDNLGSTANKIGEEFRKMNEPLGDIYVMQSVCEVENLIPHRMLSARKKGHGYFFSKDLSYYDMKVGLRYSILYEEACYNYWKAIFPNAPFTKRNQAVKASKSIDEYRKKVGTDNVVTTCYGSNILKEILDDRSSYLLNEVKDSDLTLSQINEWNAIGEKIFCWACSMKPQRA